MENKDLVIIALIVLVVYLYYQQTQQKVVPEPNSQQISELKQQINHYQTLYQKRVQKDLAGNQEKEIQTLTANNQQLEQEKNIYQQKVGDLETSLLNLAKKKVKGKKEASQLVNDLKRDWEKQKLE
jgi:capsule polysaccharide export protein KpsE/RkpR